MRQLNLDQLQTLVAIADLGTLAAAAKALHLAPPTVSLHVKEMEARLNTALLERGSRRTSLTPMGETFVHEGRKLLRASQDLVDLIRNDTETGKTVVKIGVSAGVAMSLLPLVLEALAKCHPKIELKIEPLGSAEALRRVQDSSLDVALIAQHQGPTTKLTLKRWRNDPVAALVPADWHPPKQITPDWLSSRRWTSFSPGTQMYRLISAWLGQAGYVARPFLTLDHPGALRGLATAGQSAAVLPLEEATEGDINGTCVRQFAPPIMRPMSLAYRGSSKSSRPVNDVVSTLLEFGTDQEK